MDSIWQKAAFLIAHQTTIWLTLVLLTSAYAAWQLSLLFAPKPDKSRETVFSRRIMFMHAGLAVLLWLANWLLS